MTGRGKGDGGFRWRGLVLEFLSVLLGVLAAFGVDEWRTNQANRERGRVALTNITREIQVNRDHLQQVLDARKGGDSNGSSAYSLGWGLQRTAWDVAQNTGAIEHLEYDVALSISSLYQFQQTYSDLIHGLASAQMVAVLTAEGDDTERIEAAIDGRTRVYLDLLAQSEKQLLDWYERSLGFARDQQGD